MARAKAPYCHQLRPEREDAQTPGSTAAGVAPLTGGGAGGDAGSSPTDFMAESRSLSRDKNISMTEAMRQTAQRYPDLYDKYRAECGTKRLSIKGGKAERL